MKKKLIIVLCSLVAAVTLVVVSVMGTVAYLTASAKVTNVFTVGNVFLSMYESPVDADGVKQGSEKNSASNSYTLIPGKSYDKDPTIYVGSETSSAYLFVLVRNDISSIEVQNDDTKPTMKAQMEKNGWKLFEYATPSTGTRAYVYHGLDTSGNVNANPMEVGSVTNTFEVDIFEKFYIDSKADVAPYGGAGVTLTAIGIQTDFEVSGGKTVIEAAWDAVVQTYPYIYDIEHGSGNNA